MTLVWIIVITLSLYYAAVAVGAALMYIIPTIVALVCAPYKGVKALLEYKRTGQTGKAVAIGVSMGLMLLIVMFMWFISLFIK